MWKDTSNWCYHPLACTLWLYAPRKLIAKLLGSWVLPQRDLASPPFLALCFSMVGAMSPGPVTVTFLPQCTITWNYTTMSPFSLKFFWPGYPMTTGRETGEVPTLQSWLLGSCQHCHTTPVGIEWCRVGEWHSIPTWKAPNLHLAMLLTEDSKLAGGLLLQ